MSDTNQITVRGRVGTDPDVLLTPNGKQMTKFRLGSTRSYRDAAGEWRETETEWFTVKTWGAAGQAVRDSLHRGMPVIVHGVLSSEEWVSGERTHHTNVITASAIGVDVKYGLVTFAKVTRLAPADSSQPRAEGESSGEEPVGQPEPAPAADPPGDGSPGEGPPAEEAPDEPAPVVAGDPVGRDAWVKVDA